MATRDMLINYVPGEESRIAIVEDGTLEELYHERTSAESHVGNIYKGRVTNVEPSIQAAFIDFGLERNGFLHISDLHPMYFRGDSKEDTERVGKKTPRRERPPIQKCLRRGQEVLVQVLKEGIGTKGPTLTSYLSIPGRFIVMMPYMERLGVSRKIEDDDQRKVMRKMLDELSPPEGFGFIIRTAGMDRTKTDLKRDLAYLQRLWKAIERRKKKTRVGELYTESDLIIRTLRDIFSSDIQRVIVDDVDAAKRARDFLAISNPRSSSKVLVFDEPIPLFHSFGVEQQIDRIHSKEVPLKSGGSIVIESTEALVAIDVNSGKMRDNSDAETTAYKTNVEATDEICRQLRLRDLGGVVVCDLIDMRRTKDRRAIEQRFRDNLKNDRARTKTLSISQFGILEMTRQRMRPSLNRSVYRECDHCAGRGEVKKPESVVLDVMRQLALVAHRKNVAKIELTVSPDVAFRLLNTKRADLVALERRHGKPVMVRVNGSGAIDYIRIVAFDDRGGEVDIDGMPNFGSPKLEPVEKLIKRDRDAADSDEEDVDDIDDDADEEESSPDDEKATDKGDADKGGKDEKEEGKSEDAKPRKRRRRSRGRRRKNRDPEQAAGDKSDGESGSEAKEETKADASSNGDGKKSEESKPGDEAKKDEADKQSESSKDAAKGSDDSGSNNGESNEAPKKKRSRRGRRRGRRGKGQKQADAKQDDAKQDDGKQDDGKSKQESSGKDDSSGGGSAQADPSPKGGDKKPESSVSSGYTNQVISTASGGKNS